MPEDVKGVWDTAAESWSHFVDSGRDRFKLHVIVPAVLDLLPAAGGGARALDLCCGEGFYSRKLRDLGFDVCGADVSEKMIGLARLKQREIPYHCSDAAQLPFADGSFDLVLCAMGLMDAPNLGEILAEVRRVLAPRGRFVFAITHPCFSFEKAGGWEQRPEGKAFFKMDDYFTEDSAEVPWAMQGVLYPFTTLVYHRTVSTYVNALIAGGFAIECMTEPTIDRERGRELNLEVCARVAYFLAMRCRAA